MLSFFNRLQPTTQAYLQLHLSVFLWGATGVLGQSIQLSEGVLVFYRLLIVSISLYVYLRFKNSSLRVSKSQLKQLFIAGSVLMFHWLFFYGAIKYSNVSITLSLLSTAGLFSIAIDALFYGKKINYADLGFGILAVLGVFFIFYTDENNFEIGIILALLAALLSALFNILNKDLVVALSSGVVSFYEMSLSAILLFLILPFYLYFFQHNVWFPSFSDWIYLFILAIFCTHFTLILSFNALRYLTPFTLNLSINLEPVYGIALAFVIFRENEFLNSGFFMGSALIILSVIFQAIYNLSFTKTKAAHTLLNKKTE